jgi:hypothetical protein
MTASSGPAATSFLIEAGTSSGRIDVAVLGTGSASTTWSYNGVPPGRVFYVRLRAVNAAGWSLPSNEVIIGTVTDDMPAVVDVRAPGRPRVDVDRGFARLAWSPPSPGATARYLLEIYRDDAAMPYRVEVATGESSVSIQLAPGVYVAYVRLVEDGTSSPRSPPALFQVAGG